MLTSLRVSVSDWWTDRGARTEEYQPFPVLESRNRRQETLEIPCLHLVMGLPRGVRVLEVGCGIGVGLKEFGRRLRPTRLVGIDIDDALVARARARLSGAGIDAELIHGDIRELPFPDRSFDLVFDFGTCYHIARPERAILEIDRVLTGGGFFVYETRLTQLLSHPVRSRRRALPERALDSLGPAKTRLLWAKRQKQRGAA